MAIVEDASAPAVVTGTTNGALTSASFTPPAGSLIVAVGVVGCNTSAGETGTTAVLSDSLSGSWTNLASENTKAVVTVAVRTTATSGSAMTVTVTPGGTTGNAAGTELTVRVLTGTQPAASQPGATAVATSASPAAASITPQAIGSYIVGGANDIGGLTTFTANAQSTLIKADPDSTNGEGYGSFKGASLTSSTSAVTIGMSNGRAGACQVAMAEILALAATGRQFVPTRMPFGA